MAEMVIAAVVCFKEATVQIETGGLLTHRLEQGEQSLLLDLLHPMGWGRAGSDVSSFPAKPSSTSCPWLTSSRWPVTFHAGEMVQEWGWW